MCNILDFLTTNCTWEYMDVREMMWQEGEKCIMMSFTVFLHVGSASCCLFHAAYKLDMWKLHYNIAEGIAIFHNVFSIFINIFLPPLNNNMHSHPVKVALPRLPSLEQGVLQCLVNGSFPKDQTHDTLMVQIQDCRVDLATPSTQSVWMPLWCAHFSAAWCCQGGVQCRLFSCGTSDEWEYSEVPP